MSDEALDLRSLRCVSFHSVKGGVGKSTLSYLVARELAKTERVALIDADLTGTSLADVLDLRPPHWNPVGPADPLPLHTPPDGWREVGKSVALLDERSALSNGHAQKVPLLNDFLLWTKDRYDPERDVDPRALFWKLPESDALCENLFVIPSSALPNDLGQILPLIYDELHAAYLESRFEWLLHWILEKTSIRTIVFDTPPTIPGVSRSVLSMAIRLPQYRDLAEDGGTPRMLTKQLTYPIQWTPCLVATPDTQDLGAANRWLEASGSAEEQEEIDRILVVLNRADDAWENLKDPLIQSLSPQFSPDEPGAPRLACPAVLQNPVVVREEAAMRLFRKHSASPQNACPDVESLMTRIRGSL